MKKTILILVVASVYGVAFFIGCNDPIEKVEKAEENVIKAHEKLDDANQEYEEYMMDVENYKKEMAERVEGNKTTISELRAKIDNVKEETKEKYRNSITALEKTNNELQRKITEYKEGGKETWETFKAEFSHDMDELGAAFKAIIVDDVK